MSPVIVFSESFTLLLGSCYGCADKERKRRVDRDGLRTNRKHTQSRGLETADEPQQDIQRLAKSPVEKEHKDEKVGKKEKETKENENDNIPCSDAR